LFVVCDRYQIAQEVKKHDTLGQDLVAMCVNDILTRGTTTVPPHAPPHAHAKA
jgi:phosphoribosylaminoimidazole (AIR) synthetase